MISVCYVHPNPWGLNFYYSHFTDKEAKTQGLRDLSNVSQLISRTVCFKQEQFASKVHSVALGYYTTLSQYL